MSTGRPPISDAEWEVMNVLWERAPLGSAEMAEALREATGWHPKTVQTLLGRLVKKGYLAFDDEGGRYLYRPAVARRECVRRESRSFLDRVFAGDAPAMLLQFVEEAELTPAEIEELRRVLDEKEGLP
jgi:BlaI family transcriptional regulator, penicillinase repressor